jgi:hypothetical protein
MRRRYALFHQGDQVLGRAPRLRKHLIEGDLEVRDDLALYRVKALVVRHTVSLDDGRCVA